MVLIEAWNNLRESSEFKFYELRKIKICEPLTNQSIQNIAISNNIIFIATRDALKVIVVPLVLEFEWSPRIQNQILDTYNSVLIPLSIKPTYLSICNGKSGVLVVSGPLHTNANQTQIQFFDLTDLNAVNSDLKPFSTIDLVPTNDEVISLDWHPEYNESLFIVVLASGALISVGVNLNEKRAQILGILPKKDCLQNERITCASWSPKGKQFVIGTASGQIIQIKHTNGTDFLVAKKIEADPELKGYEINAIKWCFTPLFIASFVKMKNESDFDVKHITVYAPPAQKGKPAVQPVFNNHAQLCIEKYKPDLRYKTDFVHLGSVILCSTSFSSEIGVLVCDDVDGNVNKWVQLMVADDCRIDLPLVQNNQSLSKGLSLYLAETRIFKISESQTIGGRNCPLLMVISSEGILNNYYVCYPKLACPTQFETKQLEFRNIPPIPPTQIAQQASNPQRQLQTTPNVTPAQIQPQQPQQQNVPINVQTNAQANIQVAQSQQAQQLSNIQMQQIQQQKALDQAQQEKLRALQIQQQKAKEAELQKEKERKQLMEENHAYLIAIEEEVAHFSRLVLESKDRYRKANSRELGKETEKRVLVDLMNGLEVELDDIKDKMKNIDIELLENFLLENLAMAEEARSRVERDNDSKLNILFKKKPLDPVTKRKIKEINSKTIYIETNLKEINYILDQQWQDYIVSEKGKKQSTVSPTNLVYQTRLILNSLESQLRALEPVLPWKDINHKLNYRKQNIRKLATSMKKATISDEISSKVDEDGANDERDSDQIEIHRFTKKNRQNLLRILDSRPEIPIKRSSLPVDINSAIMISAVSKAKEKLKLNQRHAQQIQPKPQQVQQKVLPSTSSALNKKIIDQQKLLASKPTAQQQVKTTGTFVPPVLTQQPISFNRQPQQPQQVSKLTPTSTLSDKQTQCAQLPSKGEPLKFAFNQTDSNKPIQFGAVDQSKPQIVKPQVVQTQQPIATKQTIKTTAQVPVSNPSTIVASGQQQHQPQTEFTFKSDQLNLTFDKSNLNLLSSTPIKNQQNVDAGNKSGPLFGNTVLLSQLANKQIEISKQHTTQQATNVTSSTQSSLNKPEDQRNSTSTHLTPTPKYEDVSPATTPTVDSNRPQQNIEKLPQSTPPKQQQQPDPSAFSFKALAALSKMPISTAFQSPAPQFPHLNVLASGQQNLPNIQKTTTAADTLSTQTSLPPSTKPMFGQAQTTSTTLTNQSPTFAATTSAPLFANSQPAILSPAQGGSVFASSNSVGFSTQSTLTGVPQATSTIVKTTASSIFGMNLGSTVASGMMDLSTTKKDTLLLSQPTTTQSSVPQTQLQQSILSPSQGSNIQTPTTAFSTSTIQQQQSSASVTPSKPFSSAISPNSNPSMQQQQQPGLGFSSMCGLGGKPNPENLNKNPFGSAITSAANNTSTSLFGQTTTQQSLFGSNFSTQATNQPICTSAFSSPFNSTNSMNTGASAFGSASTFCATPMSTTTSAFGSTNSSTMINKPTFSFQQQTTSVFGQPQQATQFGGNPAFGSTFGAHGAFGSPQQTTQFGSKPTFGTGSTFGTTSSFGSSPNKSFSSPQKTGFDSFANANVPTFGSFGSAAASTSFEAIAHNQPSQQQNFSAFSQPQPNTTTGFGSSNPQFGGSQFSERRA